MLVRNLVHRKGAFVAVIGPDATVLDAVAGLARHQVGALVVSTDGEHVVGIISERDIVRTLAETGPAGLDLPVRDIMTTDVISCRPEDTVNDVMATMTTGRFRHVPVMMGEAMVGIVSIGDLVKHRLSELENENGVLHDYIATGR